MENNIDVELANKLKALNKLNNLILACEAEHLLYKARLDGLSRANDYDPGCIDELEVDSLNYLNSVAITRMNEAIISYESIAKDYVCKVT